MKREGDFLDQRARVIVLNILIVSRVSNLLIFKVSKI